MGNPAPPAQRTEITSADDIDLLVRRFYQAVIPDPILGPIFHAMEVDWSAHIPKLVDFWAGRLLGIPGYAGNPVGAHQPVLDRCPFGQTELDRWLDLWEETVDELFVGTVAERAKARAEVTAGAIATLARRHDPAPTRSQREPGYGQLSASVAPTATPISVRTTSSTWRAIPSPPPRSSSSTGTNTE